MLGLGLDFSKNATYIIYDKLTTSFNTSMKFI